MRAFIGIPLGKYGKEFADVALPENLRLSRAKEHHITLLFFSDLHEKDLPELRERLQTLVFQRRKVTADTFLRFGSKENPRIYGLGFSNDRYLQEIYSALVKLLPRERWKYDIRGRYLPHVTLARVREIKKQDLSEEESEERIEHIIPVKLDEIVLYESRPEKGMNRYISLERVKLR